MDSTSVLPGLRWAFVVGLLLMPSAMAADTASVPDGSPPDGLVVQQIGDVRGRIADAVAEQAVAAAVTMAPFSRSLDASATPIILATGKAFLPRNGGNRVLGLRPAERRAIRESYDAGQVILLLDASIHDIEALHVLLGAGVAYESTTDPVVLAYALHQENGVPIARLVTHPAVDGDRDGDGLDEGELALRQALEIVIAELTRPPAAPEDVPDAAGAADWGSTPVQSTILTSTTNGIYNTPIEVYALHACQQNKDYYLVNTGGDWTATQATYQSADAGLQEITVDSNGHLTIKWQPGDAHCAGGGDVGLGGAEHICGYWNYPLSYEVDIVPASGPTVVQANAAPAGDQGLSASYQSGFSFSIGGSVSVSGMGPSGGIQTGVSWNNQVSTTVPPLVIEAGDKGEGTFTRYRYCTSGSDANCTSTIQMTGPGICHQWIVGPPQQGQTPQGRLSNVAQTVNWQVDPNTYTGATFDITVTWTVDLATSISRLWGSRAFENVPPDHNDEKFGPTGSCNNFGCSCSIDSQSTPTTVSYTFKVPLPSSSQCPS